MKGLLMKDFLVLRKALKTYLLILVFYLAISVTGSLSPSLVCSMTCMIILMVPISAFSYDELSGWNRYAVALPLSRATIVPARYLFVLILEIAALLFGLLTCALLLALDPAAPVSEALLSMAAVLGFGLVVVAVLLPLNYKLGPERARPYLYLIVFIPVLLLFAAGKLGLLNALPVIPSPQLLVGLVLLFPAVGLAAMAVSYPVSCRIINQKDL